MCLLILAYAFTALPSAVINIASTIAIALFLKATFVKFTHTRTLGCRTWQPAPITTPSRPTRPSAAAPAANRAAVSAHRLRITSVSRTGVQRRCCYRHPFLPQFRRHQATAAPPA